MVLPFGFISMVAVRVKKKKFEGCVGKCVSFFFFEDRTFFGGPGNLGLVFCLWQSKKIEKLRKKTRTTKIKSNFFDLIPTDIPPKFQKAYLNEALIL